MHEYKTKNYHLILEGNFLFYHHDRYFFLWKNASIDLFQLIMEEIIIWNFVKKLKKSILESLLAKIV